MNTIKEYWKRILGLTILLIGLVVGLYLVQHPQIFKSRASGDFASSLDIDNQTQEMVKDANKNGGVPTYTISGDKVKIKLKDGTVEKLNQDQDQTSANPGNI